MSNNHETLYEKLKQLNIEPTNDNKLSRDYIEQIFEQNTIDVGIVNLLFNGSPYITIEEYTSWRQSLQTKEEEKVLYVSAYCFWSRASARMLALGICLPL